MLLANNIANETAGKGLCLHPAPFVIGDFEKQIKANQGIPMAYTVHDYGVTIKKEDRVVDPQYQGREFLIESIFLPLLQFSMGLPVDFIQHIQLLQRFNHYAMAGIMVRDNSNGTVSIAQSGRTSVSYQLKEDDVAAIAKGTELVSQMWFELGAKKIITSFSKKPIINSMDEIQQLIQEIKAHPQYLRLGSAHPQSGNRIGTDASNSVVDPDCKVHGFSNLFVCDASVFPNAVGVNPQITVMTIASITAERISNNWNDIIS